VRRALEGLSDHGRQQCYLDGHYQVDAIETDTYYQAMMDDSAESFAKLRVYATHIGIPH